MSQFWIDIEDSDGIKQGFGPIASAQAWTHTAALDRAGTFSFTMPADDPRRNNLAVKRIARCWTVDNGALKHLGAGIINDINLRLDAEGAPVLTVSGDDLLHELTYRNVGALALVDASWFHPSELFIMGIGEGDMPADKAASSTYWPLFMAIDYAPGDTTTREADPWGRSNTYNRQVIIKSARQFTELRFVLHTPSFNPEVKAEYWDVSTGDWESLSFSSDTTVSGGLSWQQDGVMTFTAPPTWGIATGDVGYKIRFVNTTYGCPGDIYDLSIRSTEPTENVLGPILGCAPAGWSLDTANGYYEITGFSEYGPNLITNAGFEDYTGTQDDGSTDAFTGWTVGGTAASVTIEATADASAGTNAVKIVSGVYNARPYMEQAITVEANAHYVFECDSRGDGTSDGFYAFNAAIATDAGRGRIATYQWTGVTGTSYAHHTQIIAVPPDITTIYLELRGNHPYFGTGTGTIYWDNLSLRKIIGGGDVQLTFANESVLEALIRVCETNGEHFILSPSGRQVLWLRNDVRSSGVRCVGNVDPQAVEDEPDIALLVNVTETQSAYDLVSRVYPFGGGQGDARATLAHCTRGVPDGYTLDKTNNYLARTASEAAYGRIDRRLDLPDIVALNQSPAQLEYASNMLFDRAYTYLRRHSATSTALTAGDVPRAYNLTLAKCDRILLPGHTVKVEYETWYNQTRQLSINRDMWILSSTVRVDETGIHTVALQCATTDTPPMTDAMLLAEMLRKQRASFAHAPGV